MKVEYLKESQDGALVRLFDFNEREVAELKHLLDQLVDGKIRSLALHEHCNINSQGSCHLTFLPAEKDKGIQRKGSGFECVLTKSSLSSVSELVGSFAFAPAEGYEWLDETSDISLLISPEKRW
jgi:hypothetical protein